MDNLLTEHSVAVSSLQGYIFYSHDLAKQTLTKYKKNLFSG